MCLYRDKHVHCVHKCIASKSVNDVMLENSEEINYTCIYQLSALFSHDYSKLLQVQNESDMAIHHRCYVGWNTTRKGSVMIKRRTFGEVNRQTGAS